MTDNKVLIRATYVDPDCVREEVHVYLRFNEKYNLEWSPNRDEAIRFTEDEGLFMKDILHRKIPGGHLSYICVVKAQMQEILLIGTNLGTLDE